MAALQNGRGPGRWGPFALAAVLGVAVPSAVSGQGAQPRYTWDGLACSRLRLEVVSKVETRRGSTARTERASWDGTLLVDARDAGPDSVAVVAWFETLTVRGETPEGRSTPETGGLVGGRYRGVLDATGAYRSETVPFLPQGVEVVADLGTALAETFPPLPPGSLAVGQSTIDSAGWAFDRLSDTVWAGHPAYRFRLVHRDSSTVEADFGRGQRVRGTSIETERGRLVWMADGRLARWTRLITTRVSFPPATLTPEAVTTVVEQERRVTALGRAEPDRCSTQ